MPLHNKTFYHNALKKHGISARGLNWNSRESQEIRFAVLTQLLKEELATCSIVDAGCGFGDLYLYWEKEKTLPQSYIGIDCVEKFVEISQERVKNTIFLHRDIIKDALPKAHWYVASGSLNILNDFDTWLFLEKMLENASKGVVFNILLGSNPKSSFNYKTKKEMSDFAQEKNLHIEIAQGYLPRDMSVKLTKA